MNPLRFRSRPRRSPVRLLATVVAAVALLACITGLGTTTAAWAVPAPSTAQDSAEPAAAQLIDGRVTLSIDSLSPEVVGSGQDVTVSGTIANGTDRTLERMSATVQAQNGTEITVTGLKSWLADETDTAMSKVHTGDLGVRVAPGEVQTFSIDLAADDLPFGEADQWGPRGLQLTLSQGGDLIAQDRTILVWDAGAQASRSHTTTIIPVTASPADMSLLTTGADPPSRDALADLRTRIASLLALAGDGVVLAVDPALLHALGVTEETLTATTSSASASPSASGGAGDGGTSSASAPSAQPSQSAQAPPSPSSSSSADPTAAASPSGSTPSAQRSPGQTIANALTRALAAGDVVALPWADVDVSALAHLDETDLLSDAATRTGTSEVVEAGAPTSLTWLAGDLDATTLSTLPDSTTTIVTSPGDLPVTADLTYTPSEVTSIGSRTVLTPDEDLSDALGGTLRTGESSTALSDLDATQLLRGETAILTRQAPAISRSVVVTLDRTAAASIDADRLARRLKALQDSSWTSPQGLKALTAEARAQQDGGTRASREDVPDQIDGDDEVPASDLAAARTSKEYLDSVTSILTDPQTVIGSASEVVERTASAVWRSDPAGRTTMAGSARERGTAVTTRLTAVPSRTINLIAAEANLPVRITSSLDQDATVMVRLRSSSARLQTVEDVTLTVPADGQATATVPVKAVGSGDVDLTIMLLAADGTAVGAPQNVHMRVHADWETRGTRVMGAGLVILLIGGIVRTVRRGRRTATPTPSIEEKT